MEGGKERRSTGKRKGHMLSLSQNGRKSDSGDSGKESQSGTQENLSLIKTSAIDKNDSNNSKEESSKDAIKQKEAENVPKQGNQSPIKDFCPICQVPLPFIKIPAELHTAHCLIDPDNLPECPDGIACVSNVIFHYRDFNHNVLASWRSSPGYIPLNYQYPSQNKSAKKRPSMSPLSLSSRKKIMKVQESENVDDPDAVETASVCKALFVNDEASTSVSIPDNSHNVAEAAKIPKTAENDDVDVLNTTFLSDGFDKLPVEAPKSEEAPKSIQPLKCNVKVEYNANKSSTKTSVISQQSSCSVSCLSPGNEEELQAVCTVSVKAPGGKPQIAASKSPVHLNLLMNESGWEAVQVDCSSDANVQEVDISLCKCARAMTFKCLVADPKITDQSYNSDLKVEHKYSAVLTDLGVKIKPDNLTGLTGNLKHSTAHDKVNSLKNTNCQLSIKSFFKSAKDQDDETTEELGKPAIKNKTSTSNGDVQQKNVASKKSVRAQAPMILLAGNSANRPMTPIALGQAPSVSKASKDPPPRPRRAWGNSTTPVPQYKRIPGAPFVVDAFKWGNIEGVRAYFLSHFHSDHYIGLAKRFDQPIYCSRITANLVQLKIGVDPQYLHILEIGEARVVCNVEVEVFDANHCPGSLMFLFRLLDGRCILHVGDFRASPVMEEFGCLRQVDILYLDTTYCDPAYDFPSQSTIVEEVVRTAKRHIQQNPKTLFVCGSYTVGKEKVFLGLAEALDCQFWTKKDKAKVLQCLGDDIIAKRLTSDPRKAQIRVLYMKDINFQDLESILEEPGSPYTSLVAFEPTGWTTSKVGCTAVFKKNTRDRVTIYSVPYSEHSSFSELRRFVRFVRPNKIQVTVNLGKQKLYQKYFKNWLESNGGDQGSLDAFFSK